MLPEIRHLPMTSMKASYDPHNVPAFFDKANNNIVLDQAILLMIWSKNCLE